MAMIQDAISGNLNCQYVMTKFLSCTQKYIGNQSVFSVYCCSKHIDNFKSRWNVFLHDVVFGLAALLLTPFQKGTCHARVLPAQGTSVPQPSWTFSELLLTKSLPEHWSKSEKFLAFWNSPDSLQPIPNCPQIMVVSWTYHQTEHICTRCKGDASVQRSPGEAWCVADDYRSSLKAW